MKSLFFSIAALLMLGILITSCQKEFEDTNLSNDPGIEQGLKKGRDLTRLDVGKTLNRLISSKSTNKMLVSAIGDDELPLVHLKDVIGGRSTLRELMDVTTTPTESILSVDPLLNLFVYYPNDEKDFGQPITNVAVVNDRRGESEALLLDPSSALVSRNQAIALFNKENFTDSYREFSKIESPVEEDLFYKAMCLFYLQDFETANAELLPLLRSDSSFFEETRWFLAITEIKLDHVESAKHLLSSISAGEWNYDKSQDILNAVD